MSPTVATEAETLETIAFDCVTESQILGQTAISVVVGAVVASFLGTAGPVPIIVVAGVLLLLLAARWASQRTNPGISGKASASLAQIQLPGQPATPLAVVRSLSSTSAFWPGRCELTVESETATTTVLTRQASVDDILQLLPHLVDNGTDTKPDSMALLKSIPLIFGYMFGGVITFVAIADPSERPFAFVGLGILGVTEGLRRLLFRSA